MRNIKLFDTHAEYEAAQSSLILPNVSFCKDTPNEVHYNPYVEPAETRVVAKFNVTDTSGPTLISNGTTGFSAIEIDGVEQPSVTTIYTFSTTGEHTVKYTLTDPTSIGNMAFNACSSLTSITIPDSVTTISGNAFSQCSSLTSINIPDSVTSIGYKALYDCPSLTSCTIGTGVTSIGAESFRYCTGLTSIDIPDSVTSIGGYVFDGCKSLTSCTIGSGVTSIGDQAFYYCTSLTSVTVNAIVPPTLADAFTFASSSENPYPIYVPSGSVDTYKAATNWRYYAKRIQAIP